MILYDKYLLQLDMGSHPEVLVFMTLPEVRCSFCGEIDIYASSHSYRSCLIRDGVDFVSESKFTYVTPQHTTCVEKYQIEKVAPTIE